MQKIYAYVDETGQDTLGRIFIVSVVISEADQENLLPVLVNIEEQTGKKKSQVD